MKYGYIPNQIHNNCICGGSPTFKGEGDECWLECVLCHTKTDRVKSFDDACKKWSLLTQRADGRLEESGEIDANTHQSYKRYKNGIGATRRR